VIPAPDRKEAIAAQTAVTGIDFVHVEESQTVLNVFFLNDPTALDVPLEDPFPLDRLRIYSPSGGESIPEVPAVTAVFAVMDNRPVLRITTQFPGDFSLYRLHIEDVRIDPYFNGIVFSFKANCPSGLDCKQPPHECPPEEPVDYPVDYAARDFWSMRQALLDFASERYPDWKDRLEADIGVMWIEALAAETDFFSYYQDRITREHRLATATQRRSVRRHARLVDYELDDGRGAETWLDFTIVDGHSGNIPAGAQVWEPGTARPDQPAAERRALSRIVYEVGRGLADRGALFAVDADRNTFEPHSWDEDDLCLPVGSTGLFIRGHHAADLPFDDFADPDQPAKWMILRTSPSDPGIAARTWAVRVIAISDSSDPVLNVDLTRLEWDEATATPFEIELESLEVRGNILPATAGETLVTQFRIGPAAAASDPPEAIERAGPNATVAYRFTLPGTRDNGLVRLGETPQTRRPELRLFEATPLGGGAYLEGQEWEWRRSFVGVNSSQAGDFHFTLEDGAWDRVVGFRRIGGEFAHRDYAEAGGETILFGDGEFGQIPAEDTMFQAVYRLGNGKKGNVAPETLTDFDPAALTIVAAVTNPLEAVSGVDPETVGQVRMLAPEAWRALTYRAVRAADYAEAVERLPWVQRAGAEFRWTGSWHTVFVTPDPRGAFSVAEEQRRELFEQLNRFRQAGREAYGRDPRFASIDLEITVCVSADAFRGDVKERILTVLFGETGFFSPDNFTFGTALDRSRLEAVIQAVPGVRAVEEILIRHRGRFAWRVFSEASYAPAPDEVIRIENNTLLPERGAVKVVTEGGA
jgi:hypothetical protein